MGCIPCDTVAWEGISTLQSVVYKMSGFLIQTLLLGLALRAAGKSTIRVK